MVTDKPQLPNSSKGSSGRDSRPANLATPEITETIWTVPRDRLGPEETLIICCVFYGSKYSADYVYKLQSMVRDNLPLKHSFICLSDRELEGVRTLPLPLDLAWSSKYEGWWKKVALFRPSLFPQGSRVVYFDLDVVITGDLTDLVMQWAPPPLTMIYNFGPNRNHCAHNSSVMGWAAGDPRLSPIWYEYQADPNRVMKALHGDQCWIWRVLRDNIANWPKKYIQSYKYDVRNRSIPAESRVVVFHGDPKPHQVNDTWVQRRWV